MHVIWSDNLTCEQKSEEEAVILAASLMADNIRYHVDSPVIMAAAAMVVNDYIDVFDDAATIVARPDAPPIFERLVPAIVARIKYLDDLDKNLRRSRAADSDYLASLADEIRAMWYRVVDQEGNDVPV